MKIEIVSERGVARREVPARPSEHLLVRKFDTFAVNYNVLVSILIKVEDVLATSVVQFRFARVCQNSRIRIAERGRLGL